MTSSENLFLNDIWSLYFHDNNSDWDIKNYIFITTISSNDKFIEMIKHFLFRDDTFE